MLGPVPVRRYCAWVRTGLFGPAYVALRSLSSCATAAVSRMIRNGLFVFLLASVFDIAFLQGVVLCRCLSIAHETEIVVQYFLASRSFTEPQPSHGLRGSVATDWGCMGHSRRPDVKVTQQPLKLPLTCSQTPMCTHLVKVSCNTCHPKDSTISHAGRS